VKTSIAAALALCVAGSAWASADLELRHRWADALVAVKKGVCKGEDARRVVNKIDYAAVLIVHNELAEAREVLAAAAGSAKTGACKKAVEKNLKPPPADGR